jgi:hypothetical protein
MTSGPLFQEPRCTCCELPVSSCGKAAESRQRQQDQAHQRYLIKNGWFRSQYPGACDRCQEPFRPGTLIHANGLKSYLAICCAPEMP